MLGTVPYHTRILSMAQMKVDWKAESVKPSIARSCSDAGVIHRASGSNICTELCLRVAEQTYQRSSAWPSCADQLVGKLEAGCEGSTH